MKKILGILLICVVLGLTGCGNTDKFTTISFSELETKMNNKDSFILVIGSINCQHCQKFKGTLNSVLNDYKVEVFYVDVAEFDDEENGKFNTMFNVSGTPTTVFIEEGVEESPGFNRLTGAQSYSKIIEAFKRNKYIN